MSEDHPFVGLVEDFYAAVLAACQAEDEHCQRIRELFLDSNPAFGTDNGDGTVTIPIRKGKATG